MDIGLLYDRYGEEEIEGLLNYLMSKDLTTSTNHKTGVEFTGVSIHSSELGKKPLRVISRSGGNKATNLKGFIKENAITTNSEFLSLVQDPDKKPSILYELLYLGVMSRDYYAKGKKAFCYRVIDDPIMKGALDRRRMATKKIIYPAIDSRVREPIVKGNWIKPKKLVTSVLEVINHYPILPPDDRPYEDNVSWSLGSDNSIEDTSIDKNGKMFIHNEFTLSYTGRLFVKSSFSPVQIKSKRKGDYYKALSSNTDYKYYNYDIVGSQLNLLKRVSNMLGMDSCDSIIEWMSNRSFQDELCIKMGIDRSTLKKCIYSHVFGGRIGYYSSIRDYIMGSIEGKDSSQVEVLAKEKIEILAKELKPLTDLLVEIKRGLKKELNKYNDKEYISNGVVDMRVRELKNKGINKALSFYLQGFESAYIYNMIVLCKEHGISTVSYEYDGLITDKEIPVELMDECREVSGVKVELINKEF